MPFAPFIMRDVTLTFEGATVTDYQCQVSQVAFTPDVPIVEATALCPDGSYSSVGVIKWSATLTYFQDWANADSLSNYLLENIGQTKHVTFEPVAGGVAFEADVVIAPGAIGGTGNEYATSDTTLPVMGPVTKAPAAAAATVTDEGETQPLSADETMPAEETQPAPVG